MGDLRALCRKAEGVLKSRILTLASEEMCLGEVSGHIPTGWSLLDASIGGGLPLGRVVEVYGAESVGKSSLLYHALARCQAAGGVGVLVDSECTFSAKFASSLGVDVESLLLVSSDLSLEEVFKTICELSKLVREYVDNEKTRGAPILMVWDTVAATPSKSEKDAIEEGKEFNRGFNPHRAQVIKAGLRVTTTALARNQVCLAVLNHVYDSIGIQYGPTNNTPGGRGLKFHASVRVFLRTGKSIKTKSGRIIGTEVVGKAEKSKLGVPRQELRSRYYYGVGFEDRWSLFDYLVQVGILGCSGSWYSIEIDGEILKFQRSKYLSVLDEDSSIFEKIRMIAIEHFMSNVVVVP